MDTEEQDRIIKWRLDLFQKFVQDVIDGFDAHRTRYGSLTQSVENDSRTRRNNILAGVSFTASIILGLSSTGFLPREFMLLFLIPVLIGGLVVFVVSSLIKRKVHDYILEMDASFFSAKGKMIYFRSRALSETYNLNKLDEKRIDFFFRFTNVAAGAAALELKDKFEKMLEHKSLLKTKPFSKIRKQLEEGLENLKREVDLGKHVYQERNAFWAPYYNEDLAIFKIKFKDFFDYLSQQTKDSEEKAHQTEQQNDANKE